MRIAVMPHLPYWSIRTRGWQMARALAATAGVECHFLSWGTTELTVQSRALRALDTLRRAVTNLWPRATVTRDGAMVHTLPLLDTRLVSAGVPLRLIQRHNAARLARAVAGLRPDWLITAGGYTAPPPWTAARVVVDVFDDHFGGVTDFASLERVEPAAARELQRADLVLACSLSIARKYGALLEREVHYVPNGFAGPAGAASAAEKAAARRRLRLPDDARVVGYVGNHGPEAGVPFLLEVAARLRARDPRVIVAIAGPIVARAERRAARAHPAVRVLGPLRPDEVPALLSACDIGVLPALTTAFRSHALPLKILEYGARRLPAVATPLAELALQRFPHVRFAPYGDVAAWTDAVEEALRTPFDPGWVPVIDRFDSARIAAALRELLERHSSGVNRSSRKDV